MFIKKLGQTMHQRAGLNLLSSKPSGKSCSRYKPPSGAGRDGDEEKGRGTVGGNKEKGKSER